MKLLTDIGVSAVHIGMQTVFEDVAKGRFRFGTDSICVIMVVHTYMYVKAVFDTVLCLLRPR